MQINKKQIIDMLTSRGEHDKARQADQELPETVDTDEHQNLLDRLGIDVSDLLGGSGGVGDRLGL
jgi:hypothetical protein